jgi:ankyrin repeat protein
MADAKRAEALVRAASNTNLAKVQELLAQGADPNEPGEFGRTPLPLAVRYAYNNEAVAIQIAEALLAAGAEINASPGDCLAPLRYAAVHKYKDLLSFLISKGADPNDRDPNGQTVIMMIESTPSLRPGSKRIIKILEEAGGVRS